MLRHLRRFLPASLNGKLLGLLASYGRFAELDALVVAERTSTLLKRLPGRKPYLIHIPHGAGDRAKGFEKRIRLFDHVIVAGEKDRDRMIAEGLTDAEHCSVSGYIKRAAVRRLLPPGGRDRLFANDRPVVLYNPHFDAKLSSWDRFAEPLLEAFEQQDRFNLVIAPHVRLRSRLDPSVCRMFENRATADRIIVDFGSERSNDMRYTLGADLYFGDVSSQVYEFLDRPKPCLFLNAGTPRWEDDPSFAHWRMGEVVDDPQRVMEGLDRAITRHSGFAGLQRSAVLKALGPEEQDAVAIAARLISGLGSANRARRGGDQGAGGVERRGWAASA